MSKNPHTASESSCPTGERFCPLNMPAKLKTDWKNNYNIYLIVQITELQLLVMVFHPLLGPLYYLLQVALHVLRCVAGQLVDNVLTVGLHGLLIDGLEDLALHVVLQLLACVPPVSHREGRVITR